MVNTVIWSCANWLTHGLVVRSIKPGLSISRISLPESYGIYPQTDNENFSWVDIANSDDVKSVKFYDQLFYWNKIAWIGKLKLDCAVLSTGLKSMACRLHPIE